MKFSKGETLDRNFSVFTLVALLLSPYLIWMTFISKWSWPTLDFLAPALYWSIIQSLFSSLACLIFGFVLFCAFEAWVTPKRRYLAELSLLLPNLMPPLFLALGLVGLAKPFGKFPYGFWAVVGAHVVLNSGLVAIALDRLIQQKASRLADCAWTLGVKPSSFIRKVLVPMLKGDLAALFLLVFGLSLASFSIPLLLSRGRPVTLELTIFDLIQSEGAWDRAVIVASVQTVFLFLISTFLPMPVWPRNSSRMPSFYFAWTRGKGLVFLPALGLLIGIFAGISKSGFSIDLNSDFQQSVLNSLALGISVGLSHLILFLLTLWSFPNSFMTRFLNGFLAPSGAIVGFAFLLLPGEDLAFLKLTLALTLISFPFLYRWLIHSQMLGLESQVNLARVLGAGWGQIFRQITWPQMNEVLFRASGLSALWASADFALSGILLGHQRTTLPLMISGQFGSYRFEEAHALLLPLLVLGLLVYSFFVLAGRYVHH